jgi:hypothetical protein
MRPRRGRKRTSGVKQRERDAHKRRLARLRRRFGGKRLDDAILQTREYNGLPPRLESADPRNKWRVAAVVQALRRLNTETTVD